MAKFILVGMSGSGKTTIGSKAAKDTDLKFIDIDDAIETKYGSISSIFKKFGEDKFRELESLELIEALREDNVLISTGGGVLGKTENRKYVKRGIVIFIDRSLDDIKKTMDDSNRPMVKNDPGMIDTLFDKRYNIYKEIMDFTIVNDKTTDDCINKLIKIIKTL